MRYLVAAFAASVLLTACSATRWGLITNAAAQKRVCSYPHYFCYFVIGRVSGLFVSRTLGDFAVRPLVLRSANALPTGRMYYAVFLDKLFDLAVLGILLCPSILYLGGWLPLRGHLTFAFLALLGLSLFWWRYDRFLGALLGLASQRGLQWILSNEKIKHWIACFSVSENWVSTRVVMQAYLITLARFVFLTLQFYLISVALHLSFSFWEFWVVIPLGQLGYLVAFTPGSLGVSELGWWGLLSLLGSTEVDRNSFVIGQRIFILMFTLVMGLATSLAMLLLTNEDKR